MDETRRFLRFVIPGTLFAIETAVLLLLLRPDWFREEPLPLKDVLNLGTALTALLASGALGYLFSVLYHFLHWKVDRATLDYSPIIRALIRTGRLDLRIIESRSGQTPHALKRTVQ